MAGEALVTTVKSWIGGLTSVALSLVGLSIILQVLFAGNVVPPDRFIIQHRDLFNLFPNIKHYKVNEYPLGTDVINQEIEEWNDIPNLEYLTYAELIGRLTNR